MLVANVVVVLIASSLVAAVAADFVISMRARMAEMWSRDQESHTGVTQVHIESTHYIIFALSQRVTIMFFFNTRPEKLPGAGQFHDLISERCIFSRMNRIYEHVKISVYVMETTRVNCHRQYIHRCTYI